MITSDVPLIDLRGAPRERGRAYGESLRSLIAECAGTWLELLGSSRGTRPETYLDRFIGSTGYLPTIEQMTPDLLEEVRGLAEGAGLSFQTALAMQLHDEEWVYARNAGVLGQPPARERCSSAGLWDASLPCPVMGQNVDIGRHSDGFQTLLRIHEGDRQSIVFTTAGTIGMCGLSRAGIGLCCNTLIQLDFSYDGLPVAFIVRHVLAQSSFDDALTFLTQVPHASGQNYLLGGARKVVSLECSANGAVDYSPRPESSRLVHTNHPLASDDQGFVRQHLADQSDAELSCSPTSRGRLRSLEQRLLEPLVADKAALFAALAAKDDPNAPVCRDGDSSLPGASDAHIGFTAASVVYELSDPPVMHFAAGPPSESDYIVVPWG